MQALVGFTLLGCADHLAQHVVKDTTVTVVSQLVYRINSALGINATFPVGIFDHDFDRATWRQVA